MLYIVIDQLLVSQNECNEAYQKATDTNNLILGLIKYLKA